MKAFLEEILAMMLWTRPLKSEHAQELEQLAGVGHKTASVVLSVVFNKPTFPVDTHIYRCAAAHFDTYNGRDSISWS